MSESKFSQKQDEPLFVAVRTKDPAFAQAIQQSQASLPVFRALLTNPDHARSAGAIRMVKTRIVEGNESMWLWLNVEADKGTGFTASVFEAPQSFRTSNQAHFAPFQIQRWLTGLSLMTTV